MHGNANNLSETMTAFCLPQSGRLPLEPQLLLTPNTTSIIYEEQQNSVNTSVAEPNPELFCRIRHFILLVYSGAEPKLFVSAPAPTFKKFRLCLPLRL
jgi:hypothetical protein